MADATNANHPLTTRLESRTGDTRGISSDGRTEDKPSIVRKPAFELAASPAKGKRMADGIFAAHPKLQPFAVLAANAWPVALGSMSGAALAQGMSVDHPLLVASLTGAAVQLLIALLKSLFSERRDVMTTLREMVKERDRRDKIERLEMRRIRHDLANRAHTAELKVALMLQGVPASELPEVKPLYDVEAELKVADELTEME